MDDIKIISAEDRLWQKATDFIMRSGHTWGLVGGSQVHALKQCYQIALDNTRPLRFFMRTAAGCGMFRAMQPPKPPYHIYGTKIRRTSIEATDFLRRNDRLASLLPAATRMAGLQKDVKVILPPMYAGCDVLSLQEGVLTLAVPSSAVAAKLKQQAPKLQATLQKKGWQVESVRIKIQVGRALPVQEAGLKPSTLELPPTAVQAFEELGEALPASPQNAQLIAAIRRLAERRKK